MRKSFLILFMLAGILLASCGGDDETSGTPQAPQLVFPENNSECLEGVVSSTNPNISTIEFRWQASSNASGYTLNIQNLITGARITESTTATAIPVELVRGQPYSWNVVANSNTSSSLSSDTWKFFNAGEGVSSYAPFPADLVYPRSGANISLNGSSSLELRWEGADVDNDISAYEVLFSTSDPPENNIGGNGPSQTFIVNELQTGTTYYWRVITTDEAGNSSVSEVSQFHIRN